MGGLRQGWRGGGAALRECVLLAAWAMRRALEVYREYLEDAKENWECIKAHGKFKVPAVCLSRGWSAHCGQAGQVVAEVHEAGTYEVVTVPRAGHTWLRRT